MTKDKSFHDYLLNDVFSDLSGITSRAMFGGFGFYKDGKIFGIIADGKLYFKVGDGNRSDYEEYGSKPFVYHGHKNKTTTMSYWEVPEDILEDKEKLEIWIEKALEQHKK